MPQQQPLPKPVEDILMTLPDQIMSALKLAIDKEILNLTFQRDLKVYNRLADLCRTVAAQDQELARLRSAPKP